MKRHKAPRFSVAALGIVLGSLSWATPACAQTAPDHSALLARMRDGALSYSDRLQNFICNQITTRYGGKSGSNKWKLLDVQEHEVTYADRRWKYQLLKVNGKPDPSGRNVKRGYNRSDSEFGNALLMVFATEANAQLDWDHEESGGGQRICVFRYRAPKKTSKWNATVGSASSRVAHHGFVHAGCETGEVVRLQMEGEPVVMTTPERLVTVAAQVDVRYKPKLIGTKTFLLPDSAETIAQFNNSLTKSEKQFQNYRKFEAESRIITSDAESPGATSEQQTQ